MENKVNLEDYIVNIGSDELTTREGEIGIIEYYSEGREGRGDAVTYDVNSGFFKHYSLGHCSCNGPFENSTSGKFNLKEVLKIIEEDKLGDEFKDYVIKVDKVFNSDNKIKINESN